MVEHDAGWLQDLDDYTALFRDDFRRRDQARWAAVYLQGLLQEGGRKTIGGLARRVALPPDLSVDDAAQALQNFVNQSPWDEQRIWRRHRALLAGRHAEPDGVFVLDDLAFVKQGRCSVGVQRQYSGALGRKTNCQIAVALHHAGSAGCCPLSLRLYLPRGWLTHPHRLDAAGVPPERPRRPEQGRHRPGTAGRGAVGGLAVPTGDGRRRLRGGSRVPRGLGVARPDVSAGGVRRRGADRRRNAVAGGARPGAGGQRRRRRRGPVVGRRRPPGRRRGGRGVDEGTGTGSFRGAVVARLSPSRLPGDAGLRISPFSAMRRGMSRGRGRRRVAGASKGRQSRTNPLHRSTPQTLELGALSDRAFTPLPHWTRRCFAAVDVRAASRTRRRRISERPVRQGLGDRLA